MCEKLVPNDQDPDHLTLEESQQILEEADKVEEPVGVDDMNVGE